MKLFVPRRTGPLASGLALAALSICAVARADGRQASRDKPRPRPWMYVTRAKIDGLRSLEEVRRGIRRGHAAKLWRDLLAKVEKEAKQPPISAKDRNRSYSLVATTTNRITDAALAALVTGERRYADAALRQIEAVFDERHWPEWADKAHIQVGLQADLRHGQFARALGMAYDWLCDLLTEAERRRFLEGIDRRAIRPFKAGVEANDPWLRRRSNWMTCVVGGFGILGMALGDDHPDAAWLVETARPRMKAYMTVFGPEGEFNESVQYAGSTMYVVDYVIADRYASTGERGPDALRRLADFCRWYMHATVPPGRVLGFGDPAPDMPPVVGHLSAVAAALREPTIQWFYLQYADLMRPTHRWRALELLYFDPTLGARCPQGRLPLGRAYRHQAKLITSRSSWDPTSTTSVVYAKAGQEDFHGHADYGQVCLDGFGERLIIDLGSPPGGYPRSHKPRYYNYQQWGHNVLVFGRNETGGIPVGKARRGRIERADFDGERGGAWTMDLSGPYGGKRRVVRHVMHLLPRVAVVVDEARLPAAEPISLRWHTITPSEPDKDGAFVVRAERATLAARVRRLDGRADVRCGRHAYRPPYAKNRYGVSYEQRREPFVEVATTADRCTLLSAFCVFGPDEKARPWRDRPDGWSVDTPEGAVRVRLGKAAIVVEDATSQRAWSVRIGSLSSP